MLYVILLGARVVVGIKANQKFSFVENNAMWRERRQASKEKFFAAQASVSNIFSVNSNASASMIELTFQKVAQNNQAALNAKADERSKRLDELTRRLDIKV